MTEEEERLETEIDVFFDALGEEIAQSPDKDSIAECVSRFRVSVMELIESTG